MPVARKFIPYPIAYKLLAERIAAKPEEFAAWVFMGKKQEGLDAYTNANEVDDPPRFYYSCFLEDLDYMAFLARCWFIESEILNFYPSSESRFITGKALLERWTDSVPGVPVKDYIIAKIRESALLDLYPPTGADLETDTDSNDFPDLEKALFVIAHVESVEKSDLDRSPSFKENKVTAGIPFPPKRSDDWSLAIRDMVKEFREERGALPTEQEAWARLRTNPPSQYGITAGLLGKSRKEPSIFMDELPLTRSAFRDRWRRYFRNSE